MRTSHILLIALSLCPASAMATPIVLEDPTAFGPESQLLTFEGATDPVSEYFGVDFELSDGSAAHVRTWAGDREFGPSEETVLSPYIDGDYLDIADFLKISFSNPVHLLSFELAGNVGDDLQLSLLSMGAVVDSFTLANQGFPDMFFYGFESLIDFDSIIIDLKDDVNGDFVLDNLMFESRLTLSSPNVLAYWLIFLGYLLVLNTRSQPELAVVRKSLSQRLSCQTTRLRRS